MTDTPKTPRDSMTLMTELVLPQHSNAVGTAFGGTVLAWIDICGAITAQRHAGKVAVTALMDEVKFLAPIRVGDVVMIQARINAAFRTSMEVEVEVQVENRNTRARTLAVDSFLTFVAIDDAGHPSSVPTLLCENAEDERRVKEAQDRKKKRLETRT